MPTYEQTTSQEITSDDFCSTKVIRVAEAYTVVQPIFRTTAVGGAPRFTLQPVSAVVSKGRDYTLTVVATGAEPITYQWYFEGTAMEDETSTSLTLVNVQVEDTGEYNCIATNDGGSTASEKATITATSEPLFPIYLGNAGTGALTSYTEDQIKALQQTAPQLNPVQRSGFTGVYEISAPQSGLNEYRILASPEVFIDGVITFTSAGANLPMSMVQTGLSINGIPYKIYRTVNRSSGDFTQAGNSAITVQVH
jgi:hypothetical protein